jgi:type IV pilus assembly protein PilV
MNTAHVRWLRSRAPLAGAALGFTLVEILVAIVVLSFGVLGVVGMQAAALQSNRAARNQSTAIALGRELADLMRGNKDVALATSTTDNPYLIANYTGTAPTITVNCFTGSCATPKDAAQFDMNQWLARVSAALPQARVVVCFDDTPYQSSSGLPDWDCPNTPGETLVVKIGWTQQALSTSEGPLKATSAGSRPAVVLPLIAGSAT